MLFSADEEADRWLCCALIPNSKKAGKDSSKWVQVRSMRSCFRARSKELAEHVESAFPLVFSAKADL